MWGLNALDPVSARLLVLDILVEGAKRFYE
jgi:hypothetical protein